MQFKRAGDFILHKLRNELPAHFSYHTPDHTEDVYQAAERIAKAENVSSYEILLLLTAALYHDAGFIKAANHHEEISCAIATESLPAFEYTDQEIERVCGMIRATRIPQSPQNHLEQILADADLDYLGRDDFYRVGNKLYQELKDTGILKTEQEWNKLQLNFLEQHHYFTQTAMLTRENKKQQYLAELKATLK